MVSDRRYYVSLILFSVFRLSVSDSSQSVSSIELSVSEETSSLISLISVNYLLIFLDLIYYNLNYYY